MDIWRLGLVQKPFLEIVTDGIGGAPIQWIESDRPFSFLADPFGIWRDEHLFVFSEAYDYRSRIGHIEVLTFDRRLTLIDRTVCLKEPWHLSYPFLFADQGEVWMLPEAYRSGRLTLYRCADFPRTWVAERILNLPELAIDATPLFYQGRWWLFYSPAGHLGPPRLHCAYAPSLDATWTPHPMNPLMEGPLGSRPGGTPIIDQERIILPVQDSGHGYGSGIRLLCLDLLTPEQVGVAFTDPLPIPPEAKPFDKGFHTLSKAGDVTLIDVKRRDCSFRRLPVDALGRGRRAVRKWLQRPR